MVFSRLSVGFFRVAVNGRRRILFSANQTTILSLGNAVGFASGALQSLAVPHDDFPARVRDQSLLSERVQCVRNAGSADAEHERQKFVSERQRGTRDDVLATASNFIVASAAFDTSVSLWPKEQIEFRQGARVIHASKNRVNL
jgi:hypothetical protein